LISFEKNRKEKANTWYLTLHNKRHHYRRWLLRRVPNALWSAFYRALGKEPLCRESHSANYDTRQRVQVSAKTPFSNGNHPTVTLCRVPAIRHSAKFFLITLPSVRNLMFEISGEFLDTASQYTQKDEYHFLND
jgi:hypothetical protein